MRSNLQSVVVSVTEYLSANRYNVDEENEHIKLNCENLDEVDDGEFLKLVKVCPAALYSIDKDGHKRFDYAGCLECGTCRICCEDTIVAKWDNPGPTMGVQYRFG